MTALDKLINDQHKITCAVNKSLNNTHDAEDAVGNMAVALLEKPNIKYLSAIYRNTIANLCRKKKYMQLPNYVPPTNQETPDNIAIKNETSHQLNDEISKLTQIEQAIIKGRFWDEKNFSALAKELGINYTTARSRLTKIKAKLRERLGHEFLWDETR